MMRVGVVLLLALLAACATRKFDSCMATMAVIGPALVTLDCRAPLTENP